MHEKYNRVEKLKAILYDINKDDFDRINILELGKIFTLKALQLDGKSKNKTYYEVLFY